MNLESMLDNPRPNYREEYPPKTPKIGQTYQPDIRISPTVVRKDIDKIPRKSLMAV